MLRVFAEQAWSILRISDVLAHWGGEEFLLLMRDINVDDATKVLVRIREHRHMQSDSTQDGLPPVTFSAGLAYLFPEEGMTNGIRRADQAPYRAKSEGRSRYVVTASRVL